MQRGCSDWPFFSGREKRVSWLVILFQPLLRCWVSVSSKIGHGGELFRGRERIRNSNKRKIRATVIAPQFEEIAASNVGRARASFVHRPPLVFYFFASRPPFSRYSRSRLLWTPYVRGKKGGWWGRDPRLPPRRLSPIIR